MALTKKDPRYYVKHIHAKIKHLVAITRALRTANPRQLGFNPLRADFALSDKALLVAPPLPSPAKPQAHEASNVQNPRLLLPVHENGPGVLSVRS